MAFVAILMLAVIILVLAYFALKGSDDWPDDDHLEPPKGGMTI